MVVKKYEIDYVEFYNDYAIIEFETPQQLKKKVCELMDNEIDCIIDFHKPEKPQLYIIKQDFIEHKDLIFKGNKLIVNRKKLLEGVDAELAEGLNKFPGRY